jgi:hypothetical protein
MKEKEKTVGNGFWAGKLYGRGEGASRTIYGQNVLIGCLVD